MQNPIRRNRNIGTSKQGRGQNNKMVIPSPISPLKRFYERLNKYEKEEVNIQGHIFTFIVEHTRKNCRHACSVQDIAHLLKHIQPSDYENLRLIVLRQPKRKEELLSPVWGRLIYSYEFEKDYHPAIIIEAQDYTRKFKWGKHLSPENQKELKRLRQDGHPVQFDGRYYSFELNLENVRNTQLHRTLLHEVGHYVHYLETVARPTKKNEEMKAWEKRYDTYFNLPQDEKEKFAHRYADDCKRILTKKGIIPSA